MPNFIQMTDVEGDNRWININQITEIKRGTYHRDRYVICLSDRRRVVIKDTMLPDIIADLLLS